MHTNGSANPIATALNKTSNVLWRNSEAFLSNYCYRGRAHLTYSQCVFVALVIQHAVRMRVIIVSSAACLQHRLFFTLFHKGHYSRKKSYWTQNVHFGFQYNLYLKISHSKKYSTTYVISTYFCLHVKFLMFSSDFTQIWIFSTDFRKNFKCQISYKIPVSSELFRAEGRTDRQDITNSRFSQFLRTRLKI